MKIQELAIIFVIIILPVSILLSEYTQLQIQTLKTQTEYDTKLTAATYDAIKAFQLNAQNETYSNIANERVNEITRSVKSFRNSIMSSFKLNGYTDEELNNYIPALVYTLYDGLYIYSPYENTNYRYEYEIDPNTGEIEKDRYTGEPIYVKDAHGNKIPTEGNGEQLYGLKPYISYSCRYIKGNIDVVITYALDNYITVQGIMDEDGDGSVEYVNKGGYLIDNIYYNEATGVLTYNEVEIEVEQLQEHLGEEKYQYVKINGDKYYLIGDKIAWISNGKVMRPLSEGDESYQAKLNAIRENTYARQYYKDAEDFTKWFKNTNLANLTYNDAYDEVIDENTGGTSISQIWAGNTTKVFDFNTGTDAKGNIENELSNFNQHRLAVIRHKIETNLAIAISNYNSYSNVENVFQLPQIKEDEWEQITHNISLISFLQGLPIGGKIYNGYTIVTNSESKEVVLEQNIYILGKDGNYHKIGDNDFEVDDRGIYGGKVSAGRLNLDFKRATLINNEDYQTIYYYPLKEYNASYNSIVMQGNVTTYDDIYQYVNEQGDIDLKKAFYTALGRERYGMKASIGAGEVIEGGEEGQTPEEPLETYTVTYIGNGGVVSKNSDAKTPGVDLILAPEPTWLEHKFVEWNTKSDGSGVHYEAGGIYSEDENVTLYAIWKCKLTLSANGGNFTGEIEEHIAWVTKGSMIPSLPPVGVPTRNGFTFLGYAKDSTATVTEYKEPLEEPIIMTENLKLYAVWKMNEIPNINNVTITFNLNGGTGDFDPINVPEGTEVTLPTSIPIKNGYNFDGWSIPQQNALHTVKKYPGEKITINSNMTLYATWTTSGVNLY